MALSDEEELWLYGALLYCTTGPKLSPGPRRNGKIWLDFLVLVIDEICHRHDLRRGKSDALKLLWEHLPADARSTSVEALLDRAARLAPKFASTDRTYFAKWVGNFGCNMLHYVWENYTIHQHRVVYPVEFSEEEELERARRVKAETLYGR